MAIAKPSQTPVGQGADATGSETRHPRTDHVHSSACAKPLSGLASKRTSSCRASPGPLSAAWVTGCGMPTTGWTLISFGGLRRTACLSWPLQRDRRWRNSKTDRADRVSER